MLYSMGTKLHIHVYIIFPPIVVLQCKYLDIVLSATQQALIVNPFLRLHSTSIYPKLPVPSTPSPPRPPGQPQVYSPSP